jgi:N-acyl-phosphatidylethanolamine-hydrolysing phospholipase D
VLVVPLGLRAWLVDAGFDGDRIRELDWWESTTLQVDVAGRSVPLELTATPAQHVSGRAPHDRNRRLWASWAIAVDELRVFFAGDTGYNDVQFVQIGARFGPFDCALLPIGSYAPRDFMAPVHVDPAQAVRIHRDVRSRRSLAIHWGTFFLSAEHPSAPPEALAQARQSAGISARDFHVVPVGRTEVLPPPVRARSSVVRASN